MDGITWKQPPAQVWDEGTRAYASALHAYVWAVVQRWLPEMENWLKDNAPWTDRTGNARQGLYSDAINITNQAVIVLLGHGVEYGVFLELANAGRYAVVMPAIDHFIPKLWADIVRGLRS